jgi:hypothetical protein
MTCLEDILKIIIKVYFYYFEQSLNCLINFTTVDSKLIQTPDLIFTQNNKQNDDGTKGLYNLVVKIKEQKDKGTFKLILNDDDGHSLKN